ncbi:MULTISPECIES: beta family protein [unclassified Halomonas]|uniref:beta family protein n=1 Tax=unclassified Halomonas TaxID=2609666 RepID=UPI0020769E76|nr:MULTISPECIES: beta family protein [unclassified Halomonas]
MNIVANYKYIPIMSLQPAEMAALEELAEKDKDIILPFICLKGWVSSHKLENSLMRIDRSIGKRNLILDIDKEFLSNNQKKNPKREVVAQLESFLDSSEGYKNWTVFVKDNENYIPALQLDDLSQLDLQVKNFISLKRFFVVRICLEEGKRISSENLRFVIKVLLENSVRETLFIFDLGDLSRKELLERHQYSELVKSVYQRFNEATFCVSGTSFPYSFAGSYRGELPIYERQIFDYIEKENQSAKMIYSDRASTRAGKMGGGGGPTPVRLDYPLKHDWRFIRKENNGARSKEDLYQEAALEMMKCDYWSQAVRVWGTQMIERTSLRDPYAITSPQRATAARINIHLFQQLYYHYNIENVDTEEDWED